MRCGEPSSDTRRRTPDGRRLAGPVDPCLPGVPPPQPAVPRPLAVRRRLAGVPSLLRSGGLGPGARSARAIRQGRAACAGTCPRPWPRPCRGPLPACVRPLVPRGHGGGHRPRLVGLAAARSGLRPGRLDPSPFRRPRSSPRRPERLAWAARYGREPGTATEAVPVSAVVVCGAWSESTTGPFRAIASGVCGVFFWGAGRRGARPAPVLRRHGP